jgi:hypothetical protein
MSTEEASGFCTYCNRWVLVRRERANHVLHALLTLFFCGLWLIPWALASIRIGGWGCAYCGGGVSQINGSNTRSVLALAVLGTLGCLGIVGAVVWGIAFRDKGQPARPSSSRAAPASKAAAPPADDDLAEYRANIGKTAFNKTNGVEQGRIEDVGFAKVKGEGRVVVYKVRYHGALKDSPADNVEVRDVPSTVAE